LGSTASGVVTYAHCNVLVVKWLHKIGFDAGKFTKLYSYFDNKFRLN
jgi:hypothetical protein